MIRTVLFTALLMLFVACGSVNESASFKSLPSDGWAYGDTIVFEDACADSVVAGNIVLAVRHTDAYIYSNLWLELTTLGGDGILRRDTVNVILADTYGNWQGSGAGVSYVATDTLDAIYRFDRQQPPKLRHIMRVDTLEDIEQIGIVFITR